MSVAELHLREEAGSGDVQIEDLRVVCGGCCQIISCYCLWPDCFGCSARAAGDR